MKFSNISQILKTTKGIIKHSNRFNNFVGTRRNINDKNQQTGTVSPPQLMSTKNFNKIMFRNMSVDCIHLPHISDTIYIQPKEVMLQIHQQREMQVQKPLRKKNPSELRFHNEIFSKTGFNHLVYDESLIFHRRAHYQQLIRDQIKFFQSHKNDNLTENLTQVITDRDNQQIELTLTSLRIKFTYDKEHLSFDFILPLALLPIYYSLPLKSFRMLLAGLVQFNETFDSIKINEDYIYQFIKEEFPNVKPKNNPSIQIDQNMIDNPKRVIYSKYKSKSHIHLFNWITPMRTFRVHIIEPFVQLIAVKQHIRFHQYIDIELLLFLYEKKFVSWEFYLINYMFSYKKVRAIFDKLVSKSKHDPVENMVITLDHEHIDDYSSYDIENDYIFTDENHETKLIRIISGNMTLTYNWINLEGIIIKSIYHIQFSIGEMKLLLKMSQKLKQFSSVMKRFATVKPLNERADVKFDYESLDSFNVNSFNEDATTIDKENDPQLAHLFTVQVICGKIEQYTRKKNCIFTLFKEFEVTKANGTEFYQEKKWNQGRALLTIKEDESRVYKKKETIKQSALSNIALASPLSKKKRSVESIFASNKAIK